MSDRSHIILILPDKQIQVVSLLPAEYLTSIHLLIRCTRYEITKQLWKIQNYDNGEKRD